MYNVRSIWTVLHHYTNVQIHIGIEDNIAIIHVYLYILTCNCWYTCTCMYIVYIMCTTHICTCTMYIQQVVFS